MKKLLALGMCAVMAVSMMACGKKEDNANANTLSADDIQAMIESGEVTVINTDVKEVDIAALQSSNGAISHADYIAADLESEVKVVTFVQDKQGWWEKDGVGVATFYTQAPDGAYFLYDMPCSKEDYDKMVTGTGIVVTGFKAEWSGEVEITDAKYEIIEDTFVAETTDVTALLADAALADHQNEYVSFTDMTVEAQSDDVVCYYKWDNSGAEGDDLYIKLSKDGKQYSFTVESYLRGADSDVYKAVKELKAGDVIDVIGFLYWYEGAQPHVTQIIKK